VDATSQQPPALIFQALGDPVRWSIVQQIAAAGELACGTLEATLPDDLRELGRGRKRADSRAQPVLSGPVRERILTW